MRRKPLAICTLTALLGLLVLLAPDEPTPLTGVSESQLATAAAHSTATTIVGCANATAGTTEDRQLAATCTDAVSVKLIDATSGNPVPGATVQLAIPTADGYTWTKRESDDRGVVAHANQEQPALLAITHPDYAPELIPAAFALGEQVVTLQPGATLRLHFVDSDGEPMSGVTAHLLPPVVSGRDWAASWRLATDAKQWPAPLRRHVGQDLIKRVRDGWDLPTKQVVATRYDLLRDTVLHPQSSDAHGFVTFDQLPAAATWRWGAASSLVTMTPEHESATRSINRSIRSSTGDEVRNLSGAFELAPGQRRELTVTVSHGATIIGRIPTNDAHLRPQVKLYHLSYIQSSEGPSAVELVPEGFTTAADDGTFGFAGMRPGAKVVRAYWRDSECDYVFVSRAAHVAERETHDLGSVHALPGTFTIKVPLQDRQQRSLDPQDVIGNVRPDALVQVEAWRQEGDLIDSILEIITVPVAREVRFHGFANGSLRLKATYGLGWPEMTGGRRIVASPQQRLSLPRQERIDLPLTVEARVLCQLALQAPPGPVAALELWARPLHGGEAERMSIAAEPSGRARTVTMKLLPEPYEVLIRTPRGNRERALVGTRVIDFGQERRQTMQLRAGAAVTGVLATVSGKPLANTRMSWAPEGWQRSGSPLWLLSAETDGDGRFELAALPAGWKLRGARAGTDIAAPALGAESRVHLTVTR